MLNGVTSQYLQNELYIDQLSGLYNEKFMKDKYTDLLINNPGSRLVMIDLRRFKSINDEKGHSTGDLCLQLFGKLLGKTFKESVVARLHGDEYCIFTPLDSVEIGKRFLKVDFLLESMFESGDLPVRIEFNAGDTKCELSHALTMEMADYMMYDSKKKEKVFQPFNTAIWREKLRTDMFIDEFNEHLENHSFTYSQRDIHDINSLRPTYYQIYTRNVNNDKFLDKGYYGKIADTKTSITLDIENLRFFKGNIKRLNSNGIVLMNYKSVLNYEDILKIVDDVLPEDLNKLILGFDLRNVDRRDKSKLLHSLQQLKKAGIRYMINKYDLTVPDDYWDRCEPDLVRISSDLWKLAMESPRKKSAVKSKLNYLFTEEYGCSPAFDFIDSEKEFEFIKSIANSNTLVSGNYISREKQLVLK